MLQTENQKPTCEKSRLKAWMLFACHGSSIKAISFTWLVTALVTC